MNVYYANCRYENWPACKKFHIFGLKSNLPNIAPGDLILLRLTGHSGQPYGVKTIWRCDGIHPVESDTPVPWKDGPYKWIVDSTSLVEFSQPFSEDFLTSSKISQKLEGLYATRLMGSMGELKPIEAKAYLVAILTEKPAELQRSTHEGLTVYDAIQTYLGQIETPASARPAANPPMQIREQPAGDSVSEERELRQPEYGIVGERIDLPVLNYAPLNEMGVILLFGYYMKDLGFSHLEEIRSKFPDAIGMQKVDAKKYRRVRIEFEYSSRNFSLHGHTPNDCDVIVCWEHDWPDCPLEVIELKKVLFQE